MALPILLAVGCATTTRLNDRFDSDTLSGPPSTAPSPTPPADSLSFTTSQNVVSTVVAPDPSGGRWLPRGSSRM
jgi:hypothetical protein